MASASEIHEGACRCGEVRLRVRGRPLVTAACHCTGCQKMTASAFSLSSLYGNENFEITQGEPVIGGLGGELRHYCCPRCKSWMFTRRDAVGPFVNVRATLLDNAHTFRPFIETYTSERLPWAKTPAMHGFEKFPPAETFPVLMAEFAASDF